MVKTLATRHEPLLSVPLLEVPQLLPVLVLAHLVAQVDTTRPTLLRPALVDTSSPPLPPTLSRRVKLLADSDTPTRTSLEVVSHVGYRETSTNQQNPSLTPSR